MKAHCLGWQINDETAVPISHGLFTTQQARLQNVLHHVESFGILVEEWHRNETSLLVRQIIVCCIAHLRKNLDISREQQGA